jgi:phosphoribosylformimino-5-aminoimidazole carboxamide ribonucleotide (ProFAR) isomerase
VFEVIPAIDVYAGRLARFVRGTVGPVDAFGGDPVAAARSFVEAGARRLHVVDLDLAIMGSFDNAEVIRAVADLRVPIQASGGIASEAQIQAALAAGATRVVLASLALTDRANTEVLLAGHGDVVVVGIEADEGTIRPRGRPDVELPLADTVAWLAGTPATRYVHTAVGRVGDLGGPDLDGVRALVASSGRPVVAAGGIRDLDDLRALARAGAEGAIVGRAMFEGLDLRDAMAALA